MTSRRHRIAAALSIAAITSLTALALGACGLGQQDGQGDTSTDKLTVVASFYPLQFATEQIGGDHVSVTSLTKPGAEPHDVELTPRDVGAVSTSKLIVFEKGLQSAVDEAVGSEGGDRALDVAPAANLNLLFKPTVGAATQASGENAAGENAAGTADPHFWLDPQRYSAVAKVISARLSRVDPANKTDYEKNAKAFEARLSTLSKEFETGLASCERKDIVTSHAAFGYLAQRFGMNQIAINGLSADQEPKAAELAAVSTYAKAHRVTTIYAETLVSPAIAATVASEAGAAMATLDPIEGLTDKSAGEDYFEVMRANLKTLQAGQGCS